MIEVHLERSMPELDFGHDTKMERYANLIPNILKLYEIGGIWLNDVEKFGDHFNESINRINMYINDTIQ